MCRSGADPAHIEWDWCGHAARAYNEHRARGVSGHAPPGFRPCVSASDESETVEEHHNHAKIMATGL